MWFYIAAIVVALVVWVVSFTLASIGKLNSARRILIQCFPLITAVCEAVVVVASVNMLANPAPNWMLMAGAVIAAVDGVILGNLFAEDIYSRHLRRADDKDNKPVTSFPPGEKRLH